jgi:gamma-glutamyl:cysteine ligase YbdK (ATP-grasp superfamily)
VKTPPWLVRENRWRAIQKGIKAELLVAESGETKTVSGYLESLLEELSPFIERNGYRLQADVLRKIAALGSSADRQRALLKESKNKFEKVAMRLVDELETDRPVWLPKSKDQMEPKRGGPQCA